MANIKYISDGEQLLKTAVLCFVIFPLLAIITDRSDFVENIYWVIMFVGVFHTLLLARLGLSSMEQKSVKLGLVLAGIGVLNSCMVLIGLMNVEDLPKWVIYELITIIVFLWGISLIKFLRS